MAADQQVSLPRGEVLWMPLILRYEHMCSVVRSGLAFELEYIYKNTLFVKQTLLFIFYFIFLIVHVKFVRREETHDDLLWRLQGKDIHQSQQKQKLLEVKAHVTVRPGCVRHQGGGGHGRKWRSSHHLRRLQLGVVQSCVPTGTGRLPVGLLHPNSAGCAEAGAQRWRREFEVQFSSCSSNRDLRSRYTPAQGHL